MSSKHSLSAGESARRTFFLGPIHATNTVGEQLGPRNTVASFWGAHLGQQRVAHELQLVRRDVHGHVERGAQQLTALILELYEQPLHVAGRHIVLQKQAGGCQSPSAPLGPEDPVSPPHARTPTASATAAAILRPHVEENRGGKTERHVHVAPGNRQLQRPLVFGGVRPLPETGIANVVSLRAYISQQRLWSILAAKNPEKLIDLPA